MCTVLEERGGAVDHDCDYDLNAADIHGDTVLHVYAKTGNTEVLGIALRKMLKFGKNISTQNKN